VFVCVSVCVCVFVQCVCVCVCVFVQCVCVCVCVFVQCVCVCVFLKCVCVCVCACTMCVCVCVFVYNIWFRGLGGAATKVLVLVPSFSFCCISCIVSVSPPVLLVQKKY
jgi:hypothetical protein